MARTTRVPAEIVKDLRKRFAEVTRDESHGDRDRREGWYLAAFDPNAILSCVRHLQLRSGFKLASYQFHGGMGGNGATFVIPADRDLPDPADPAVAGMHPLARRDRETDGLPDWIRPDVGSFLEGDGSDLAYFEASMLVREIAELGAWWHGISWGEHRLLVADPFADGKRLSETPAEAWQWHCRRPGIWQPTVRRRDDGTIVVMFFTFTALGHEVVLRHRDTFEPGGYAFESESRVVAMGGQGFVY